MWFGLQTLYYNAVTMNKKQNGQYCMHRCVLVHRQQIATLRATVLMPCKEATNIVNGQMIGVWIN